MRTINWYVEASCWAATYEGELEVEDDATEDEIQEAVRDEVGNLISWGWSEKPATEDKEP